MEHARRTLCSTLVVLATLGCATSPVAVDGGVTVVDGGEPKVDAEPMDVPPGDAPTDAGPAWLRDVGPVTAQVCLPLAEDGCARVVSCGCEALLPFPVDHDACVRLQFYLCANGLVEIERAVAEGRGRIDAAALAECLRITTERAECRRARFHTMLSLCDPFFVLDVGLGKPAPRPG